MADNYTQSSFMVSVDDDDQDKLEKVLGLVEHLFSEELIGETVEQIQDALPEELADDGALIARCNDYFSDLFFDSSGLGFEWSREQDDGIWFRADESLNTEMAASCLFVWLSYYDLPHIVSFEWADVCSKQRIGEFGGGSCVVSRKGMFFRGSHYTGSLTVDGLNMPPAKEVIAKMVERTGWDDDSLKRVLMDFLNEEPDVKALFSNYMNMCAIAEEGE